LVGETIPDLKLGWVSGTRATLRNTGSIDNYRPSNSTGFPTPAEIDAENPNDPDLLIVGGFGSYHSGNVLNVAFADGSIHLIVDSIDPATYQLLGNRADGKIIKPFE
jgi:prepilin-type processing-associated H-X9-DG protein